MYKHIIGIDPHCQSYLECIIRLLVRPCLSVILGMNKQIICIDPLSVILGMHKQTIGIDPHCQSYWESQVLPQNAEELNLNK